MRAKALIPHKFVKVTESIRNGAANDKIRHFGSDKICVNNVPVRSFWKRNVQSACLRSF
jgi:hypothetical protein